LFFYIHGEFDEWWLIFSQILDIFQKNKPSQTLLSKLAHMSKIKYADTTLLFKSNKSTNTF